MPFLEQAKSISTMKPHSFFKDQNNGKDSRDSISWLKSLAALAHILGNKLEDESIAVVRQIIEDTALDSDDGEECPNDTALRASALSLLHQLVGDTAECSQIIGESTLKGLSSKLIDLGQFIESDFSKGVSTSSLPQETRMQYALDMLMHIVITGSNTAKSNANIYKTTLTNLINDGTSKSSLAVEAKRIIDYGETNNRP